MFCRLCAPALLLLASGCSVGPDFHTPGWASPTTWFDSHHDPVAVQPSEPASQPVDVAWWNQFDDPELSALESKVAAQNLDVQVAAVRFAESRAQLGITAAGQYPTLNGNASYTREKASNRGIFGLLGSGAAGSGGSSVGSPQSNTQAGGTGPGAGGIPTPSGGIPPFDLYQYGFDASWELDLWGKTRRSIEAGTATASAALDAQRDALVSSLAEVARDYIMLRGTQAQLAISRDNVRTAQESLNLTQERALGGLTTDLDVANAAAQLRTNESQIPPLLQQESQLINALSLLLGEPPNALRAELQQAKPVPPVPPEVPIGLPSTLARRRPDIREAEENLHAATADVGVAVANFYPDVTLSASVGIQALQPHNLWNLDSRQYQFGPTVTLPIFQGGTLRGTLALRKAQQREAAITYQETVLKAWHDIDNAMTAYQTEQARRAQLIQAVAQNRRAVGLAQDRYRQGVSDFLEVLTAERSLLSSQQALQDSTTTVSTNLVALYKALGGGWQTDLPDNAAQQAATAAPASLRSVLLP